MAKVKTRKEKTVNADSTDQAAPASGSKDTLYIYGTIGGYEINADMFRQQLDALGDVPVVNVRINSPGGSLFDGITMANLLKAHPAEVVAHVDAVAASAASIVSMGADKIIMAPNSVMMVHKPLTSLYGNAREMRETADLLDKLNDDMLVPTYAAKTGKKKAEINKLLDAETWLSAKEAVKEGFADEISADAEPVENDWKGFEILAQYQNTPAWLKEAVTNGVPKKGDPFPLRDDLAAQFEATKKVIATFAASVAEVVPEEPVVVVEPNLSDWENRLRSLSLALVD